jgi:hypothetical protein
MEASMAANVGAAFLSALAFSMRYRTTTPDPALDPTTPSTD